MNYREIAKRVKALEDIEDEILNLDYNPSLKKKPVVQISRYYLNKLEGEFGTVAEMKPFGNDGKWFEMYIMVDGVKFFALQDVKEDDDHDK